MQFRLRNGDKMWQDERKQATASRESIEGEVAEKGKKGWGIASRNGPIGELRGKSSQVNWVSLVENQSDSRARAGKSFSGGKISNLLNVCNGNLKKSKVFEK